MATVEKPQPMDVDPKKADEKVDEKVDEKTELVSCSISVESLFNEICCGKIWVTFEWSLSE